MLAGAPRPHDLVVHRGHAREERRLPLVDGLEQQAELERRQQHQGAGREHVHGQAHGQAVDVEDRQGGEHDLAAALHLRIPRRGLVGVRDQVAVRQHRALRQPGRAAGVLQQGQVFRRRDHGLPHRTARGLQQVGELQHVGAGGQLGDELLPFLAHAAEGQVQRQPLARRQVVGQRGDDHVLQLGGSPRVGQPAVGPVVDDGHGRAAVGELVLQLRGRVERVVLDDHRTELEHGEEGDDGLRAVGQDQGHPVALAYAQVVQRAREPVDRRHEGLIRHRPAQKREGLAPREVVGRVVEQLGQGHVGDVHALGDTRRVPPHPGARVIFPGFAHLRIQALRPKVTLAISAAS